ncbi:response regulator [Pseudomonas sp. KNUC1026]|uniref:response regulator n=1 Tax=Pseudomonas sp. KNUC1026 TaxID=2893890 RepID=UPI003FA694EB
MAAVPLLICDDSNMARKQLLRALPEDWSVSVTQAVNGRQGLEAIRQGLGQVVLLDLTMPEMDGYEVLAALREEGLAARVIVVSGDVQEEAVRRVMALGALAFVKKPAEPEELRRVLIQCGVFVPGGPVQAVPLEAANQVIGFNDAFRETVNVAMGRAAALLAKVLGVFVQLPVPNVNVLEVGELHMALADAQGGRQLTAICQGYIGGGIAGEALLMFHDSSLADMARLMERESNDDSNMEMLLDLSAILIGACLCRHRRTGGCGVLAEPPAGAGRACAHRRTDPGEPAALEEDPCRGDQLQRGKPRYPLRPAAVVHREVGRAVEQQTSIPDELNP